ncbi:DUF1648 domain-containing protein [Streptomyces sp. NPDC006172]|uniref:DUF1648 domain-containing protein n=1 Tax=Streptomyces sp. NPDC006172 TaxID=3154470 RepID=UPI0033C5DB36
MPVIRRSVLTTAPFVVAIAAYAVTFAVSYDRLPARIATHFGADGSADDFMSRTGALWSGVGVLAGLGLLFTALTVLSKKDPGARLTAAAAVGTAVTLGYPLVLTVLANRDVRDSADVSLPLWHIAVLLLAGVAAGALAWRLAGPGTRSEPAVAGPSMTLAEGEAVAWSRTVLSRALLLAAGAIVLGGVLAMALGSWQASWPAGLASLVLGLVCAPFAGVRVTVDRRGLTVASTVLPRPRLALPLGDIVSAASVQVDAMGDFGGWGYRIRPGRRGVVLRSGEALSVRTAAGRDYVITVDDSTTAAALLNGLVDRRAAGA